MLKSEAQVSMSLVEYSVKEQKYCACVPFFSFHFHTFCRGSPDENGPVRILDISNYS